VVPVTNMLQTAEELSILILEEERKYSRIIHQKLSKAMAQEIFLIDDADILSAIECHTTLKSNSTMIDKILFISDKISFDLPGEHKYLLDIRSKVDGGYINDAILIYLNSIWEQRDKLKLIHPWLINAREELLLQV
jgi:HD superfamily phosphohydrolase YqeK